MSPAKNVYTIASGTPFLRCLAQFVLDNNPADSAMATHDPFRLSRTTIYLPTRRAVRTLRTEFSRLLGPQATFLPVLRTLGDGDSDDIDPFLPDDGKHDPKPIVSALSRQIMLARLVKRWVEVIGDQTRELFKDEDIIIPSSSAESLWLAKEIGDLVDQMETEEISWENLKLLVPNREEYASWWQLTLDFLQIAMQSWPQVLDQMGAVDPATNRRLLLDLRTAQLQQKQPGGPVIAAGSTGSIPATARFLAAVSQLPQGAVILPGLDTSMSDEAWQQISKSNCEDHPQFGLTKLLETFEISRDEVTQLGKPPKFLDTRSNFTSIALLPSAQTGQWRTLVHDIPKTEIEAATSDITIIEAPAERQEALAIALVLRKQIQTPDIHAALVTPDRNLARRVAGELKRFDLNIDDSGGATLQSTPCAIFMRLMISTATQPANSLTLASFIKHPFLSVAIEQNNDGAIARLFEICLLRDVLEIPTVGQFEQAITDFHDSIKDKRHIPPMIAAMDEEDWKSLSGFCAKLDQDLSPLSEILQENKPQELTELFESIVQAATNLTRQENGTSSLFSSDAGVELSALLEEITNSTDRNFHCRPDELPSVFDALIAGKIVRSAGNTHPRLSILGPLEARLQPLDCIILGGLNEGTWPQLHKNGPFLNRPMKTAMELATPERRTGLSAHDFEQLLGCAKVYLTRAERVDNAPTVPSRWLQRLTAISGAEISAQMRHRGNWFLEVASLLDQPSQPPKRISRPCPIPPVTSRPKRLSITEIETWIRDPYAIYARRILKLQPLGNIGTVSEPALRGTILHDAAAEFVQNEIDPFDHDAKDVFLSIVENHMQQNKVPAHINALWMPRFAEIAHEYILFEQDQKSNVEKSHCEIDGKIEIGETGFELRGRADRIDILQDGNVQIIDYKSGMKPTIAMARTLAPQLALEGAMVMAGSFGDVGPKTPSSLEYVRMRPRGEFKRQAVNNDAMSAQELSQSKLKELEQHILKYQNPDQGYISRFAVELADAITGDYDHLARVREWSWGNDETEGGGENG